MDDRVVDRIALEKQYRRLGTRQPDCRRCGERAPEALTGRHPNILCYECLTETQGRSRVEAHHYAGRHNAPRTVALPGNAHRVLSGPRYQGAWPEKTLRNPDGSPLLEVAATLRGWLDVLRYIVERVAEGIPPLLEWLDERLTERLGECWWKELGYEGG